MSDCRVEGVVVRVMPKGFGFVSVPNQADVFLHCSDFSGDDWSEQLIERRVSFEIKMSEGGRRRAIRARLVE